jgi:hypothetical protein
VAPALNIIQSSATKAFNTLAKEMWCWTGLKGALTYYYEPRFGTAWPVEEIVQNLQGK